MTTQRRLFRKRLQKSLQHEPFSFQLSDFQDFSLKTILNSLFGYLCREDSLLKWHSVTAFGMTLAKLAEEDIADARVVFRRLIWNLNDEGGGIGWGTPEAMAESTARHAGLAGEYSKILVSYCMEGVNFLEYEGLQRGVAWGLGRLAKSRRNLLVHVNAGQHLLPFLESPDCLVRGFAARAQGLLGYGKALPKLLPLLEDQSSVPLYEDCRLIRTSVQVLAKKAVTQLNPDANHGTSPFI